jgi:hypothetical protein
VDNNFQEDDRTVLELPAGLRKSRLISDDYLHQQVELHKNPDYGVASVHFAPIVSKVCNQYGVEELLDYGAGKGRLAQNLDVDHPMSVQHYDPAIPGWDDAAEPCEMVACIDVLEHIEPSLLDNVLDDMQRVLQRIGLFTISTVFAEKTLPDGRNAHLIVRPLEWWLPKIMERWELHILQRTQDGFFVMVMAKNLEAQNN